MEQLAQGVNAFQAGQYSEAYSLLLPFAEEGELRAQLILARLFYAGHGVEQSEEQYLYWLRRSADSGDKAAKSLLKRLDRGEVQPPFELTDAHLTFFSVFGYLHIEQFYVSEVPEMSTRFDALQLTSTETDAGGEDKPGLSHGAALGSDTYFGRLGCSDRLAAVATKALGNGWELQACHANRYESCLPIQDGVNDAGASNDFLRVQLCLDRCDAVRGGMQVIPGSHRSGDSFCRELRQLLQASEGGRFRTDLEKVGTTIFPRPGDLVLMDARLIHSAAKTGTAVRVVSFDYTPKPTLARRLQQLFSL